MRSETIVDAWCILSASLAVLFFLLWTHDKDTLVLVLPGPTIREYYKIEIPHRVEVPVILPCPRDSMKQLKPWNEKRPKKQMAKEEDNQP